MSHPCPQPGCLVRGRQAGGCAAHRGGIATTNIQIRLAGMEGELGKLKTRIADLELQLTAAQESMDDLVWESVRAALAKKKRRALPAPPASAPPASAPDAPDLGESASDGTPSG